MDLVDFVRAHVERSQWDELQKEAQSLEAHFCFLKERKREEVVRRMAGSDHTASPMSPSPYSSAQDREQERMAMGLRGIGLRQEDVDELELINYQDRESEGEDDEHQGGARRVPKVPVIDTLREPFVKFMDEALFRSARE